MTVKAFLSDGSSGIKFTFCDGPMDDPDASADAFRALGIALTSWARMEHQIDALLVTVNHERHSPEFHRQHPVSFSKKIKLLKLWFYRHPPLTQFADDIKWFCERVGELGRDHRVLYAHHIFTGFDASTGRIFFQGIKHDKAGDIHLTRTETTLEILATFTDLTNSANRFLWSISSQVMAPGFPL